jgi:nuclear protein localization family protein 4
VHIEFARDAEAQALDDQADAIAAAAGLKRVGWIFTDLERDAAIPGRFIVKRHPGTYYLKSNEMVLAAHLQSQFPNRCTFAESGFAGSKFSTVVLSGTDCAQTDNIEAVAYQVR